ncbi:MAG TPA: haloacid dehalogenase-like hydrolase [Solirubrobacteraceae bacterium]|nr:haloacid dehalogenase-like hydrolase [Solirubrobacteraceae bacterium]
MDGPRLLLFDVDGTLLTGAAHAHARALWAALHDVHGIDATRVRSTVAPAGRTDGEIARLLLLAAGVSAARIDERADDVRAACCEHYAQLCPPDLSDTVIPGIPALLAQLSERDDVVLSLVTGNFEPVGRMKLSRAGLGRFFAAGQGAFGSDAEDRAMLPGIARRRAGVNGTAFPRERTIVIGDTPRDIFCARADGVGCIAVTTGPYDAAQLADADAVARDPGHLLELLSADAG